jgi:hypothetical protein
MNGFEDPGVDPLFLGGAQHQMFLGEGLPTRADAG